VTASARLPLLCGRRGAVLLRSRRSPGAVPRRAAPLSKAGRDGGGSWSPARSIRRPSPSRRRTDRPGRLSCGFARIPSTFTGRAVPSGGCRPPDHPASAFDCDRGHPSLPVASPLRFSCTASPLIGALTVLCCATSLVAPWRRRPCGSFVAGVLRTAHVPGPRPGSSHGLAGVAALRSPATSMGFAHHPSQCCSGPMRVGAPSSRRARAHVPFRRFVPPRVPSIAGSGCYAGSRGTCRPRLLGFGPAGQPSPRGRRSRYSFCA
jgi:hypothetical protein